MTINKAERAHNIKSNWIAKISREGLQHIEAMQKETQGITIRNMEAQIQINKVVLSNKYRSIEDHWGQKGRQVLRDEIVRGKET